MAEQTTAIDPILRSLEQLYTIHRSEEVSGFLRSNLFLAPLLMEAHDKIIHYSRSFCLDHKSNEVTKR